MNTKFFALAALAATACEMVVAQHDPKEMVCPSPEDTDTGVMDGGLDTAGSETGSTEGDGDTSGGDLLCLGHCGDIGCNECPVSDLPPVLFEKFSIDAHEVKVKYYEKFVEVVLDPSMLSPECAWKTDFVPGRWNEQLEHGEWPVTNVDWCDAQAFCEWTGRSLCGDFEGEPVPFGDAATEESDIWYFACTNGDGRLFPYSQSTSDAEGEGKTWVGKTWEEMTEDEKAGEYDQTACIGEQGMMLPDFPELRQDSCKVGDHELFDMSGCVHEWSNSCGEGEGGDVLCLRRGGSIESDMSELRCAAISKRKRKLRDNKTGFRCCEVL